MSIRKLTTSSIKNNTWYRSMNAGNSLTVNFALDFLVIAGGGGGGTPGATYCGGGGAGGYRTSAGTSGGNSAAEPALNLSTGVQYTVTVGAGGGIAATGGDSTFHTITSSGGGRGASNVGEAGGAGGSGGGGNRVSMPGGARVAGQGFIGGFGSSSGSSSDSGAGGGGGAGGQGEHVNNNANTNEPAPPGPGLQSSITGTATWYAEGGSGSGYYNRGTYYQNLGGNIYGHINGNTNTGSGGGGGRQGAAGGAGGSGIVIIRYPSTLAITGGAGLTSTTTTVGSNKVTTFTAGTGQITFSAVAAAAAPTLPVTSGAVFWADSSSFSGANWTNLLGTSGPATITAGTATVVSGTGNGATATFNAIQGDTSTRMEFPSGILPSTYTLFHVTRYTGGTNRRIYTANSTVNWLSGHWGGNSGVAYHEGWLTQNSSSIHGNNWVISTDQNSLYRSNGVTRGSSGGSASTALGINTSNWSAESSSYQTAEVIVYNRTLSAAEYASVESYLSSKYGIAI